MSKTVVEQLIDTRALIAHGWTKGAWSRKVFGRQCYCLSGALIKASVGEITWLSGRARDIVTDEASAVARQRGDMSGSMIDFNDRPSTSKADVLAVLDRAILKASE